MFCLINKHDGVFYMKTQFLSVLTIACTIALVACAGGSSETTSAGGATPVVSGNTNTSGSTGSSNRPTTNQTPKIDSTIQGNIIALNSSNNRVARSNTNTVQTTSINKVVVNGQAIDFVPTSSDQSNRIDIRGNNMVRVGSNKELSYTRYGYMKNGTNATPYIFAQGHVTTDNMPTIGTATYTGNATHVANGNIEHANAEFSVDYGKKTVNGTITPTSGIVHRLDATISGNRFSGNGNMITNGQFYGPNAEEMGGTYQNRIGNINGAFGAKK